MSTSSARPATEQLPSWSKSMEESRQEARRCIQKKIWPLCWTVKYKVDQTYNTNLTRKHSLRNVLPLVAQTWLALVGQLLGHWIPGRDDPSGGGNTGGRVGTKPGKKKFPSRPTTSPLVSWNTTSKELSSSLILRPAIINWRQPCRHHKHNQGKSNQTLRFENWTLTFVRDAGRYAVVCHEGQSHDDGGKEPPLQRTHGRPEKENQIEIWDTQAGKADYPHTKKQLKQQ